jgi:hypothetical protein
MHKAECTSAVVRCAAVRLCIEHCEVSIVK